MSLETTAWEKVGEDDKTWEGQHVHVLRNPHAKAEINNANSFICQIELSSLQFIEMYNSGIAWAIGGTLT